jgi:hypothetical protein
MLRLVEAVSHGKDKANSGNDAEGAWIALNKPELIDDSAQRMSLKFAGEAFSRVEP